MWLDGRFLLEQVLSDGEARKKTLFQGRKDPRTKILLGEREGKSRKISERKRRINDKDS